MLSKFAMITADTIDHLVTTAASIAALIMSIAAIIKLLLISPREIRKLGKDSDNVSASTDHTIAETMNAYEEAILRANARAERVETRLLTIEGMVSQKQTEISNMSLEHDKMVADYQQKMAGLEAEKQRMIAAFGAEIEDRDRQIRELVNWAERLVHQVQSLGGQPVALRPGSVPSVNEKTLPSGRTRRRKE